MPHVKMLADHEQMKVGETYKVTKAQKAELVQSQKAIEDQSPQRKAIQQATDEIVKGVQANIQTQIADAVTKALNAGESARKAYAPAFLSPLTGRGDPAQHGTLAESPFRFGRYVPQMPDAEGKSLGDFYSHVGRFGATGNEACQKRLVETYGSQWVESTGRKAALAESAGMTGGFLVPPEFSLKLLALAGQMEIVSPRATVLPMGGRNLLVPTLDMTTRQATGTSPFYGGFSFSWQQEATTKNETEPAFRQTELTAHELVGLSYLSITLQEDSPLALDALLTGLGSKGLAWAKDYAFFQGDGAGQPVGVINAPATISVTRASPGHVQLVDIVTMYSKLLLGSMKSAVWVASQSCIPELLQLRDQAGRVLFMGQNSGATEDVPSTLLGLPIIYSEKVPVLGTKGDLGLYDWGAYLIGDRLQLEVMSSLHVAFAKRQMAWRFVARLDGAPWLDNSIQLADGSSLISPFVVLN